AAHKPTSRARTTLPINPAVAITRPELSYRISDPPAMANAPTATPAAPALSRTVQRTRLSGDESAISPPIINQRVPFTRIAAEHLANEDHMVAGGHGLRHPAIHPGERRLEHGSARILGAKGHASELVLHPPGRESSGERLVTLLQNVHGKDAGPLNAVIRISFLLHTHEHERRVEGHGGEGVRSQAAGTSLGIERGDHRNAGREVAQDATKLAVIDHLARPV